MTRLSRIGLPLVVLCGCVSCLEVGMGGPQGTTGGTGTPPAEGGEVEEGSCNAWKVSYCNAVEACEPFSSRQECEDDVGYLRCLDDSPYSRCQQEIDEALAEEACERLPGSECTPEEIADRSTPVAACRALHEELCERDLFCGATFTLEDCLADRQAADPCEEYFAVWPGIDPCLEELPTVGCAESIPEVCLGILRK